MVRADVCIVGAGPAGIAVAERLSEAGVSVCIIESGLREPDSEGDALNTLSTDTRTIKADSRSRAFGGTTKLWSGRWKTFDPIDFEQQAERSYTGWPISLATIEPYYDEAARRFFGPSCERLRQLPITEETKKVCGDALQPTVLWTIPSGAFDIGALHEQNLRSRERVQILLGTTVVILETSGPAITQALCRNREGDLISVTADQFIIAGGAIENARLLLHAGVGGPAVGRYFMEHPKGVLAVIRPRPGYTTPKEWLNIACADGRYRVGIRLSDTLQRSEGLLNAYVQLEPVYPTDFIHRVLRKIGIEVPLERINVMSYLEQSPEPNHCVSLGKATDAFGVSEAHVSYELSDLDKKTIVRLHEILRDRVVEQEIGTMESSLFGPEKDWQKLRDASHHIGTTRMGTDPKTSVVDTDCKVHTLENLYVAGSSVFPTGGHANPTATIIALALRLGDHLLAKRKATVTD